MGKVRLFSSSHPNSEESFRCGASPLATSYGGSPAPAVILITFSLRSIPNLNHIKGFGPFANGCRRNSGRSHGAAASDAYRWHKCEFHHIEVAGSSGTLNTAKFAFRRRSRPQRPVGGHGSLGIDPAGERSPGRRDLRGAAIWGDVGKDPRSPKLRKRGTVGAGMNESRIAGG